MKAKIFNLPKKVVNSHGTLQLTATSPQTSSQAIAWGTWSFITVSALFKVNRFKINHSLLSRCF